MPIGPMDGGAADRPKPPPPKAPDRPPPPDAPKPPPDAAKPADRQQDDKGAKDNLNAAPPQGGKPAEVPKVDAPPHQAGDTSGRQTGDGGHKPGDAAKPGETPHQAGDHPGKPSADMGQFQKQFERLEQSHPEARTPADVKGAQHLDRPAHPLDLDQFRENNKFDQEKLRVKLEGMVQQDKQDRTVARLHAANDRDYQGPRPGNRPMEVTFRIENPRSYVDVRNVQTAMQKVCDDLRVNGRVEIPGRPPEVFKPHSVLPHDHGPVRLDGPPTTPHPQDAVRPPRQVPQPSWHNTHPGR